MAVHFHEEDLPADLFAPGASIAVDTETMGLITPRDRLCVVQLSDGRGDEHLVRFSPGSDYAAPHLRAVLADPARLVPLVRRLTDRAAQFEASARHGTPALPFRAAWAVLAAARIYGGIGRKVAALGARALEQRVSTSGGEKLAAIVSAWNEARDRARRYPPLQTPALWTRPRR